MRFQSRRFLRCMAGASSFKVAKCLPQSSISSSTQSYETGCKCTCMLTTSAIRKPVQRRQVEMQADERCQVNHHTAHRLILCAVLLAAKLTDDRFRSNSYFSKVFFMSSSLLLVPHRSCDRLQKDYESTESYGSSFLGAIIKSITG